MVLSQLLNKNNNIAAAKHNNKKTMTTRTATSYHLVAPKT